MRMLLIVAVLVTAGCSREKANICGSLPMQLPYAPKTADDQRQVTYSCVERWAARLSKAPDAAHEVADAAVAACEETIVRLANMTAAEDKQPAQEPDRAFWRSRAQFIAVQARAGDCYPDA